MMKPVTGQYECLHRSGVGLDYFTSRIDRLTLLGNGRFTLISQDHSRLANAAQSLISGQQVSTAAPEKRREGTYTAQDKTLLLHFDDGTQEQGQLSWNGDGVQIGKDFFSKISDSTLLPPTHRLKKDMDDIAKGLKIAGAIGGMAIKAAKTIHDTLQTQQEGGQGQAPALAQQQPQQAAPPRVQPVPPAQPGPGASYTPAPAPAVYAPPAQPVAPQQPVQAEVEALHCDQCGARIRPGKRFCSQCGARLPEDY